MVEISYKMLKNLSCQITKQKKKHSIFNYIFQFIAKSNLNETQPSSNF